MMKHATALDVNARKNLPRLLAQREVKYLTRYVLSLGSK